ncbi:MAG: hypothetical protein KDD47_28690 [Acidobacteria bacterium]|nr:hypothetical protein [Acidobacteriota bacterium]
MLQKVVGSQEVGPVAVRLGDVLKAWLASEKSPRLREKGIDLEPRLALLEVALPLGLLLGVQPVENPESDARERS